VPLPDRCITDPLFLDRTQRLMYISIAVATETALRF
jgi:hypothetical protein